MFGVKYLVRFGLGLSYFESSIAVATSVSSSSSSFIVSSTYN